LVRFFFNEKNEQCPEQITMPSKKILRAKTY